MQAGLPLTSKQSFCRSLSASPHGSAPLHNISPVFWFVETPVAGIRFALLIQRGSLAQR